MAQHKLSEKKSKAKIPPKIQKKKSNSKKTNAPKKGTQMIFAPKKKEVIEQAKSAAKIAKVINDRNEELIRDRLVHETGRTEKK